MNKNDGLPAIARETNKKKLIAVISLCLLIGVFIGVYFYKKPEVVEKSVSEESYALASEETTPKYEHSNISEEVSAEPEKVTQESVQEQVALVQEKQKELQQRLSAPLMLVNNHTATAEATNQANVQTENQDSNSLFLKQAALKDTESVFAKTIGPLNYMIAEGSFIHAILETASNSDLPGSLRATVDQPIYSEDGSQILIPRGTRLIGQYKSGMLQGQTRIFIAWTRIITPTGISVQLGSAGVDDLGVAGMEADEINRHFWERFGTASLLSLIGAGAANVGVTGNDQDNSAAQYRSAIANSFSQSANQSLQMDSMIAPTLKTYQGKPIMVFVAKDINFQNAMKQVKPKMNVF